MAPRHPVDPAELAERIVEQAKRAGADVAEVEVTTGLQLGARVRLGELELLEEAGSSRIWLRIIRDHRVGVSHTSDLSEGGLDRCIGDALELAALSEPDELAAPAEPSQLCRDASRDLDLFDPAVLQVTPEEAVTRAREAERAALASDSRLTLSEGARFERATAVRALALSTGFCAQLRATQASLEVSPAAEDEQGKRRLGYAFRVRRHLGDLDPAEAVGRDAARRTLRKLGARKLATCEAPVVFEPETARSILQTFAGCVLGSAVWRKSTYLAQREGTAVASPLVTIVDDPLVPRGLGSRPCDGEGLGSRRNLVVERGVLNTFLMDCYSGRKLERASTGSAGRTNGIPTAVTSNFLLEPGEPSLEQIVASTRRGLLVTELMGFGFNPVTGDFSQGAAGMWIEDGETAFAVSEVTISSTLDRMLQDIDAVGCDLGRDTPTAAPTVRVGGMTIGGT